MTGQNNRFGINMIKYCKEHEEYIGEQLSSETDLKALLVYHNTKLQWLQHERLIHLIVTVLTAILFFFLFGLEIYLEANIPVLILLCGVMVLLAAYLFHYFKLENAVQHWYKISDEIYFKLKQK